VCNWWGAILVDLGPYLAFNKLKNIFTFSDAFETLSSRLPNPVRRRWLMQLQIEVFTESLEMGQWNLVWFEVLGSRFYRNIVYRKKLSISEMLVIPYNSFYYRTLLNIITHFKLINCYLNSPHSDEDIAGWWQIYFASDCSFECDEWLFWDAMSGQMEVKSGHYRVMKICHFGGWEVVTFEDKEWSLLRMRSGHFGGQGVVTLEDEEWTLWLRSDHFRGWKVVTLEDEEWSLRGEQWSLGRKRNGHFVRRGLVILRKRSGHFIGRGVVILEEK
jgi:hypothetical protein